MEILIEIIAQLVLVLIGIFFVHRIVTYVPTYSGKAFGDMNLFTIVLVLLALGYESGTTVGNKIKILIDRSKELWEGKKEEEKKSEKKKDKSIVKITQPISRNGMPTHQPSRADYISSHNKMVSPTQMLPPPTQHEGMGQGDGTSNEMYEKNNFNGLVNAATPIMSEPMAANEGFGAFSSF